MRLLYVFSLATSAVVAGVWALGEIDTWWILVPAVLVYLLSSLGVMQAVARALRSEDDQPLPH